MYAAYTQHARTNEQHRHTILAAIHACMYTCNIHDVYMHHTIMHHTCVQHTCPQDALVRSKTAMPVASRRSKLVDRAARTEDDVQREVSTLRGAVVAERWIFFHNHVRACRRRMPTGFGRWLKAPNDGVSSKTFRHLTPRGNPSWPHRRSPSACAENRSALRPVASRGAGREHRTRLHRCRT